MVIVEPHYLSFGFATACVSQMTPNHTLIGKKRMYIQNSYLISENNHNLQHNVQLQNKQRWLLSNLIISSSALRLFAFHRWPPGFCFFWIEPKLIQSCLVALPHWFFAVVQLQAEFWKNKPERVFSLQVQCRELDIFKIKNFFRDYLEMLCIFSRFGRIFFYFSWIF